MTPHRGNLGSTPPVEIKRRGTRSDFMAQPSKALIFIKGLAGKIKNRLTPVVEICSVILRTTT